MTEFEHLLQKHNNNPHEITKEEKLGIVDRYLKKAGIKYDEFMVYVRGNKRLL